jgi:hypothetical protein
MTLSYNSLSFGLLTVRCFVSSANKLLTWTYFQQYCGVFISKYYCNIYKYIKLLGDGLQESQREKDLKGAEVVVQVIECLPGEHKALKLKPPSTGEKKENQEN